MTTGPEDGPAVVLLHGFPEYWYGWRRQIRPLAEEGFHVIVPDQRGYNESSKPPEVRDYRMSGLTADVLAIADQLGREKIFLAGHDWGAAVAWNTAITHPERVGKLAILNVPHPKVMMQALRTNPRQMARSWYIAALQIPRLPEFMMARNNFAALVDTLRGSSRPGTFSDEDIESYRVAWGQPGALAAMVNWYRAVFREMPDPASVEGAIDVPTRIIWGVRDKFIGPEFAELSLRYCTRGELFTFPEATHWVQHEEAERVNRLLIEFFG